MQLLTEKSNLQIDTLEYSPGRYRMIVVLQNGVNAINDIRNVILQQNLMAHTCLVTTVIAPSWDKIICSLP